MKPSDSDWPGVVTLNTARLLASALATKSIRPSGVRARLLGVLPDGASGCRAQRSVSSGLPSCPASRTLTFDELEQAMNSVLPSGANVISVGCDSVGHVPTTFACTGSMTATAAL